MPKPSESNSRFLSLVLRHAPERIGLALDREGWADLDELVARAGANGVSLTRDLVVGIVAGSDKRRFALSEDGRRIRANQGHSVAVDLGLVAQAPPELLYHGTATRFLRPIGEQGLLPGSRQSVHLSATTATALAVGARHGTPVVLTVRASAMHRDGHAFSLSANGVWLTAAVPAAYIEFPAGA